jgi:predicted CoA-binding protein
VTRDPELYGDDAVVTRLLRESAVWAFVGLSSNPERPVYGVSRTVQAHGKRIVPVHPRAETVHGETGYETLSDAVFSLGTLDVVGCYVNSRRVGEFVDEAIAVGAGAVWLPLDVVDERAAGRARDAGLDVVMDRCPAIEWGRGLG